VTYGERLRELRAERGLSLREVGERGGPNKDTMSLIERGVHRPQPQTLGRIAEALGMSVSSLRFELETAELPLGEASPSQEKLFNNGALEEERRAAWEAAVDNARRLRETGRAQMWKALAEWSASKERSEPYAARREYLDEMGGLLQEVYGAYVAVGEAYVEAALTQGGDEASVPSYLKEESRLAEDFYVDLFGLVRSVGLGIRRGEDAAAAKRRAEDQAEARPHSVEESEVA
jgi:transcriptional regulator with XRE-family HTH domain